MSNPGAKQFAQVTVKVDIWLDPEKATQTMIDVADEVGVAVRNAADSAAKEIDAPDQGIEVCVR